MTEEVFIVSACRTAIGSFMGQFSKTPATELGTVVIKGCLDRAQLKGEHVSTVYMGHVLTAGQGQNPARQASLRADIPNAVPASTINMLCGSGLKAVYMAYNELRLKEANVAVAGGQESMTQAQFVLPVRDGHKLGHMTMKDTVLVDGLTDAFHQLHMGMTGEHLAQKYNVERTEQDKFAYSSQQKASAALDGGHFNAEIVPVTQKRTNAILTIDEFVKKDTTLQSLGKLKPAFKENGSITAGNASGVNDGAAALLLANGSAVAEHNLTKMARIVAMAETGCEPIEMGLGPIEAVKKVLSKAGWTTDSVDLYELNEAFAVQSIIVLDQLKLNASKVNITGGAIALGHPIGSSGARCLVTLLYNLRRTGGKRGVASLCVGGGMGIAIAIEIV